MSVWVRHASKDLEFQNLLVPMQTNHEPEDSKCKVTTATTPHGRKATFGNSWHNDYLKSFAVLSVVDIAVFFNVAYTETLATPH